MTSSLPRSTSTPAAVHTNAGHHLHHLHLRHLLLALAVVAVWGSNFVVIKVALAHVPPLLFAALRFAFALVPALFFVARPAVPWTQLAAYGVLIGVGQFGVLYLAINGHISPGLASLVIQTQVFFTIGMAMFFTRERVQVFQWAALLLAVAGIAVIGLHTDGSTTFQGVLMVVFGAFCWAGANTVAKQASATQAPAPKVNMLGFVIWSSAYAVPPLLLLSLVFEGWPAMRAGLTHNNLTAWAAVFWQAWGNTLFGYAAWAWLLSRYPAATISPIALLVPVIGMGSAAWMLGESLPAWKLSAALLVMAGLALNTLWPRWKARLAAQ
jgi:O-acetylserine/cysteine efflux transporter